MDATPILPRGWHFASLSFTADGRDFVAPLQRIDHPVRYYIIDFDCSVRFTPGESPIRNGLGGRDDDAPELAESKPFDHLKLDIFTLGNVFFMDLYQVRVIYIVHRAPYERNISLSEISRARIFESFNRCHDGSRS